MQSYIVIFVFCIVSAAISCAVHKLYNKDKTSVNCTITTFAFYAVMFYALLSFVKTVLGNGRLTLAASFDEVLWQTYLHYFIPLAAAALCMPFIISKIFRSKLDDFIAMTLSVVISIFSIAHLILGKVSNLLCLCIAAAGVILALIITYAYKKEVHYYTRQELKKRLSLSAPIVLFWIILMMLYLPNELYFPNAGDLGIPYGIFIRPLLLSAAGHFIVYVILMVFFLTENQFSLICETIFAITFASYMQGMILNGKMDVMDGSRQTWSVPIMIFNIAVWIAIIGIVISLKYFIKRNVDNVYSMICIYLSIIQLFTWGYLGLTTETASAENDLELTTDGRLALNPENNVLVFILDWFDGQILDKIMENDADILEPLQDFTWYKNMTSLYGYTYMSVPYLLTDVEWQYDMTEDEYISYAYQNGNLLPDIAAQNYDIGVYTAKRIVSKDMKDIIRNYSNIAVNGWSSSGIIEQMLNCSKYKSYPFVFKSAYWYADGDMSRAMRDKRARIHNSSDDSVFYDDLLNEGIQIEQNTKYEGAFRFYHLDGVHTPFKPDMRTKGKNALNIVYEYIDQLKEAGLYDNATIIITADHGHNYLTKEERLLEYDFDLPTSPILFVKKANQTNEDGVAISMAPVSHSEMAASIMKAVCGDSAGYGEAFDDINEDSPRERYFVFRRHDDIPYKKYVINGYVRDWNNWTLKEADDD